VLPGGSSRLIWLWLRSSGGKKAPGTLPMNSGVQAATLKAAVMARVLPLCVKAQRAAFI